MQKRTADLVIEKGGIRKSDLRYLFAGDLLGQLIATSFGTVDLEIPLFGLYGACSTMGEAPEPWRHGCERGDMPARSCPWHPAILQRLRNSSVFRWPMATKGPCQPPGP